MKAEDVFPCVLAVDQSSARCGFAVVKGQRILAAQSIDFPRSLKTLSHSQRRKIVVLKVQELVEQFAPACVAVEGVRLFSSKKDAAGEDVKFISRPTMRILDRLIGAIIDHVELPVYSVETQAWKYAVLGNRAATKDDAVWYVLRVLQEQYPDKDMAGAVNHDLADACGVGIFASTQSGPLRKEE